MIKHDIVNITEWQTNPEGLDLCEHNNEIHYLKKVGFDKIEALGEVFHFELSKLLNTKNAEYKFAKKHNKGTYVISKYFLKELEEIKRFLNIYNYEHYKVADTQYAHIFSTENETLFSKYCFQFINLEKFEKFDDKEFTDDIVRFWFNACINLNTDIQGGYNIGYISGGQNPPSVIPNFDNASTIINVIDDPLRMQFAPAVADYGFKPNVKYIKTKHPEISDQYTENLTKLTDDPTTFQELCHSFATDEIADFLEQPKDKLSVLGTKIYKTYLNHFKTLVQSLN